MANSSHRMRCSREQRAVWQLSAAVFCIFAAYMPAANLASSLEKQIGYYANAAGYASFALGGPFAGGIVHCAGAGISFAVGGVPYVTFLLASWALNAALVPWPVYICAAALNGLGAALLWTALGVYTNDAARSWSAAIGATPTAYLGRFNAIPWWTLNVAAALSQLACGLLLPKFSAQIIFLALTFVSLVGCVIASLLPRTASPTGDACLSDSASASGIFTLLCNSPVSRWFVPVFLTHGFNQGFMFGTLPATASDWLGGSAAPAAMVMACNSVANCVATLGLGFLSDAVGFKYTLLSTAVCDAAGCILLVIFAVADLTYDMSWLILLFVAGLLACADAGWQTQGSAGIGCLLRKDESAAFSLMVTLKGVGTATAFFLGPLLSLQAKALVLLSGIIFGMLAVASLPSHAHSQMLRAFFPQPAMLGEDDSVPRNESDAS